VTEAGRRVMGNRLAAWVAGFLVLALALPWAAPPAFAQQGPKFPPLTGRVTDAADVIPPDVEARLDQKLTALEAGTGRQLVVATVPDLQGYEISDYGYQLGRTWGIGSKERNDGALLIVAPKERKVRIEVGYGLEGVLTDGLSSLIISQQIVPRFKQGDLPGGIEAGTDAIVQQLGLPPGEAQQAVQQAEEPAGPAPDMLMFALFVTAVILFQFVFPLIRTVRQRRRYPGAASSVFIYDLLANMPRSSSSSGSSGGGGFSGGGGSFGGGGSSGSW